MTTLNLISIFYKCFYVKNHPEAMYEHAHLTFTKTVLLYPLSSRFWYSIRLLDIEIYWISLTTKPHPYSSTLSVSFFFSNNFQSYSTNCLFLDLGWVLFVPSRQLPKMFKPSIIFEFDNDDFGLMLTLLFKSAHRWLFFQYCVKT